MNAVEDYRRSEWVARGMMRMRIPTLRIYTIHGRFKVCAAT